MGGGGASPFFTSHGLQMLQSKICFDFVLTFTHMHLPFSIFLLISIAEQHPQIKSDLMNFKQVHAKGDRQKNTGVGGELFTLQAVI